MTALLEGVRAALMTAVADIDAHAADSAMEREIALAAVARHRADAAGDSGAALTAFVETDTALWDLVEKYAARIDVARVVGHAPVVVPARRPTIELDDALRPPSSPEVAKVAARPAAAVEPRRPTFRLRDGETSGAQRAWEHLVKAGGAVSTAAIAAAAGMSYNAAAIACRKWREGGFVVGHHAGWRLPGAPDSAAKSLDQVAERVVARAAVPSSDGFDGDDGRTHSEANLPPLPSRSSIKAGPPAAQTTMLGRIATPPAPERGSAWRGKMAPRPEEADAQRAQRNAAPPPIAVGGDVVQPARPRGAKVEPVAPPRVGEELRRAAKVDPIGAVSGGARGGGLLL